MSQIARGSYKAAVTVCRHIPKPSGIGSRECFARRLRLADQNSPQRGPKLFFVCEDRAGQFRFSIRQGNESDRIYGISLSYFFAGLLALL